MNSANIYLNFKDNTEEVFDFYKSVFGGDYAMVMRFGEMPDGDKMPTEVQDKIMHIALPLGPNHVLMGSDTVEGMGKPVIVGNNFSISLSTESKDEADRLYGKLSDGGQTDMPMENTFWGSYFGMLTDPYGVQWMISYDENYQN